MRETSPYEYALGEAQTHESDLSRHASHLPSHRGRRLCLWCGLIGQEYQHSAERRTPRTDDHCTPQISKYGARHMHT